jgi:hypothetical protein
MWRAAALGLRLSSQLEEAEARRKRARAAEETSRAQRVVRRCRVRWAEDKEVFEFDPACAVSGSACEDESERDWVPLALCSDLLSSETLEPEAPAAADAPDREEEDLAALTAVHTARNKYAGRPAPWEADFDLVGM